MSNNKTAINQQLCLPHADLLLGSFFDLKMEATLLLAMGTAQKMGLISTKLFFPQSGTDILTCTVQKFIYYD
jgi:hypothetical protein